MDEKFEQLREAGRNCVDCLMDWIKESKIIDKTAEAEEKALKMFEDVRDRDNVELEKFKEVVSKLAEQQQKTLEETTQKLVDTLPTLLEAFQNAAKAFQETMTKK